MEEVVWLSTPCILHLYITELCSLRERKGNDGHSTHTTPSKFPLNQAVAHSYDCHINQVLPTKECFI